VGHQETVEEMRAEKSEKYKELKNKPNDKEYDEWFLRYRPSEKVTINKGTRKNNKGERKNNKGTSNKGERKKNKGTRKKKSKKGFLNIF
jgi:hypothetical protein